MSGLSDFQRFALLAGPLLLMTAGAVAVDASGQTYSVGGLTIGAIPLQPRALTIPGVLEIDLRSGVVKLDPKARTEPAEVAEEFWKAVELIAGRRSCETHK